MSEPERLRALVAIFAIVSGIFWGLQAPNAYDPIDEVSIHPPTGAGSGSGTFTSLDNAIDEHSSTGSVGSVAVRCSTTCLNEFENVATWQGFPDGFEPLRLQIASDAGGGLSLASGRTSQAYLLLEYDIGNGWETADEETWNSTIPACSESYPSRCANNVFIKDLDPEDSTGVVKVRATVRAKMTSCGNCGTLDTSNMTVMMTVRDIQVVARAPRLIAEPSPTVTRGDTVTLRVVGAPVTSYSNWRYIFKPAVHSDIIRQENINTGLWSGPLLLSGTGHVVVIVPGQSLSIPLDVDVTVNPRAWNSLPKAPEKVTGIAAPPGLPSPPVDGGDMGYSTWNLAGC